MLLMCSAVLPLLANVVESAALEVPTCVVGNPRLAGVRTTAPRPSPLRSIAWGDPAASSSRRIDAGRGPTALGVKVTENVQLPAAGREPALGFMPSTTCPLFL